MEEAPRTTQQPWMSPRLVRYLQRGGVVLGGAAGLFSFLMVDLARRDAVFTTGLDVMAANTPPLIEFTLTNASDNPMTNADISFGLFDAAGVRIRGIKDDGTVDPEDQSYFVPRPMTIGENASKFGPVAAANIAAPLDQIAQAWVCAVFDGSFWIDRVRTEFLLVRSVGEGQFAQFDHKTTVHFFTTPDCIPPESIAPRN